MFRIFENKIKVIFRMLINCQKFIFNIMIMNMIYE